MPGRFVLLYLVLGLVCGGCSLFRSTPVAVAPQQKLLLDQAMEYLADGRMQQARMLLEQVSDAPSLPGVTDEAYFRLALFHLGDEGTVKAGARAEALLERLKEEFPKSIWAQQAIPLNNYLLGIRNLRDRQKELKAIRELNQSLTRDNRELRQTIDRLKNLDMELEQKIKR